MIFETSRKNYKMECLIDEDDIRAPIANIEIDEFFDNYINDTNVNTNDQASLKNSVSLCNSLEDLVKTFDKNVKDCLRNYKNIDIGQLAPVQVRSQEDIINDSQMWYTLTGNFGNLLPITDYSSKRSLIRHYHNDSLNIKNSKPTSSKTVKTDNEEIDLDYFSDEDNLSNEDNLSRQDEIDDYLEFDEDEEELREQLDMHSMILIKGLYNDCELDEPLITAEQVLNEIDSMMNLQDELIDEMTPDSGFYSSVGLNTSICSNPDIPNELSYIKYINTFATHESNKQDESTKIQLDHNVVIIPSKKDLQKLNTFELNEIIEQIESHTKELSEVLVQEFASRDELEFEKETRNTFISLLSSIQEKRRQLCLDNLNNHTASMLLKKKNRKSLNLNFDTTSSHLTTVIPYNNEIEYDIPHLQILNKLLKAIDEDSHQVPELLTNYILKVVCPT